APGAVHWPRWPRPRRHHRPARPARTPGLRWQRRPGTVAAAAGTARQGQGKAARIAAWEERMSDQSGKTPRAPRRIVLLSAGEQSEVVQVLREYSPAEVSGVRLHADLQQLAGQHAGQLVAAEWQGTLGWTRFLWCRK